MGRNQERDIRERGKRKQLILNTAFPIFAEKGIEMVSMSDIAAACGMSYATIYRHYSTKSELVLAINNKIWDDFFRDYYQRTDVSKLNAAEEFNFYLDIYLDLYRHRRDILRFNHYFNAYIQMEDVNSEQMQEFAGVMKFMEERFHGIIEKAKNDGTLRTDIPEDEIFSATMHLMLAAVTRYSVGLVYQNRSDIEKELFLLKDLLYKHYCVQ